LKTWSELNESILPVMISFLNFAKQ
jgi:hypothetical protein